MIRILYNEANTIDELNLMDSTIWTINNNLHISVWKLMDTVTLIGKQSKGERKRRSIRKAKARKLSENVKLKNQKRYP
jgi:hypothetical protein